MQPELQQPEENDEFDLENYKTKRDQDMESDVFDMEAEKANAAQEPSWKQTVGEFFTQLGLGAAQAFTWPADVIKLGALTTSLGDMNTIEAEAAEQGIPFDKKAYVKGVMEASRFVPTQKDAEKAFEEISGISLEPETEIGKRTRQGAAIFALTPGGISRKATSAATGILSTEIAKGLGVGEGKAELIGDIASVSPNLLQKGARTLSAEAAKEAKIAERFELPFLQYMTKEKAPLLGAKITANNERIIRENFKESTYQALNKIVKNEIPLSKLRDKGVNLNEFAKSAYDATLLKAQQHYELLNTTPLINSIDKRINQIRAKAPNPSEAQQTSINLLERERNALEGANPTSEQLINQHFNYNQNLKSIYKKPEFTGAEDEIRTTYEFLKKGLLDTIEKQGNKDVAHMFRASNHIYHESSKLAQSENMLAKAFPEEGWNAKSINKILNSRKGPILERNLGKKAVEEIREIANYGERAQEKMQKFITKSKGLEEIPTWGQLAPLILFHGPLAKAVGFAKPITGWVNGWLLTRPATRKAYGNILRNAAKGSFSPMKKDFAKLEESINQEWGDVDTFMDSVMQEID